MLVAMSRIIWKPDFACLKSVCSIRRSWICLPLLSLAMPFCPSSALAQQTDRSVLVIENSTGAAGSNAQVDLESEFPQAADSTLHL